MVVSLLVTNAADGLNGTPQDGYSPVAD